MLDHWEIRVLIHWLCLKCCVTVLRQYFIFKNVVILKFVRFQTRELITVALSESKTTLSSEIHVFNIIILRQEKLFIILEVMLEHLCVRNILLRWFIFEEVNLIFFFLVHFLILWEEYAIKLVLVFWLKYILWFHIV
jgi:hypothetical protein